MSDSPPRRAERILAALLPSVCRDEALDELGELYELRATRRGVPAAER